MLKKISSFVLILLLIIATTNNNSADAATITHEKRGIVPIYNANGGGILASVALIVYTNVYTSNIGGYDPDGRNVNFYVHTSTLNSSFLQCGGTMTTITPSKLGSISVPLVEDRGAYIGDANFAYSRFISKNTIGVLKGNYTVTSAGQFYPSPSSCIGGGKVTDTFSAAIN